MPAASIAGPRSAPRNRFRVMTVIFGAPLRGLAWAAVGIAAATTVSAARSRALVLPSHGNFQWVIDCFRGPPFPAALLPPTPSGARPRANGPQIARNRHRPALAGPVRRVEGATTGD